MAPTARLPPKKDVALALLEQASMYIHLDPRADSVHVPVWFKKQPQLVLQVGLNMAVPIPDLRVTDDGISCTLSFNRAPFFCSIPWRSVFALVGEKGQAMVWAEDVPAEVAAQAQAQKQPPERPRAHLRSVGDDENAPTPQAAVAPAVTEEAPAAEAPAKKAGSKKTVRATKDATEPKRASKAGSKKVAAKKGETEKPSAAKKPAPKPAEKEAQPGAKAQPRPKAAVAAKQADKPAPAPGASDASKPKRELPPYLRVVK